MTCLVTLVWQTTGQYKTEYRMTQEVINAMSQQEALGIAIDKERGGNGQTLFLRSSIDIGVYVFNEYINNKKG